MYLYVYFATFCVLYSFFVSFNFSFLIENSLLPPTQLSLSPLVVRKYILSILLVTTFQILIYIKSVKQKLLEMRERDRNQTVV